MNEPFSRPKTIEYLVSRRFPLARHMRASSSIGGNNPVPDRHRVLKEADEFATMLRALPDDKLIARVEIEKKAEAQAIRAQAAEEEAKRPYNRPDAVADIAHWGKLDYWSLDEAVALSLGRDPRVVNPTALKPFANLWGLCAEPVRTCSAGRGP